MRVTSREMLEQINSDQPLRELVRMHKYMRPAGSQAECEFSRTFIAPLPGVWQDARGNWIGTIGHSPMVLWSSHTDTVHNKPGYQSLALDGEYLCLGTKEQHATCLGADCTVGVWLMRRMYLAGVPGLYVWHAEEECGGNGSAYISNVTPGLLDGIQAAIAFDRRGKSSVVTHQFGQRTASDRFAASLAAILGGDYAADDSGVFTDTANYQDIVPECTNISVGYEYAHTEKECTDLLHARELLDTMLAFDASRLMIERDPANPADMTDQDDPLGLGRWPLTIH